MQLQSILCRDIKRWACVRLQDCAGGVLCPCGLRTENTDLVFDLDIDTWLHYCLTAPSPVRPVDAGVKAMTGKFECNNLMQRNLADRLSVMCSYR